MGGGGILVTEGGEGSNDSGSGGRRGGREWKGVVW